MRKFSSGAVTSAIFVLSLVAVAVGWRRSDVFFAAVGGIGACYVLMRIARSGWKSSKKKASGKPLDDPAPARPVPATARREKVDPGDTHALVEQMLTQGRYALLLRPQIAGNLSGAHFLRAREALEAAMALVPDGEVVLGRIDEGWEDGKRGERTVFPQGRVVLVERFFLDRYPVTNRQFYEFVAGGGYEQIALWDESIWPAVLDFVDRTGLPGPCYWRDGRFLAGEENHPVVGVSWHEAGAYARWVGKRLPSDAEWVKAGSWPVPSSAASRPQRKYPWGDTMDRTRANLWGSGPNRIVPVDEFAEGVSVGGVYQLIGNVWEWTSGNFRCAHYAKEQLLLPVPMKGIHGGAFDTYFDNQATCQFQSGEDPLRRRHNIGFRLAIGVCDLSLTHPASTAAERLRDEQLRDADAPAAEEVPA